MPYNLDSGRHITLTLPIGGVLTLSASTGATGTVVRLGKSAGDEPNSPVAYSGAQVAFGPYDEVVRFRLHCSAGNIPYDYTNPQVTKSNAYATKYQKTVLAGRTSTVMVPAGSLLTALANTGASGYIAPVDGTFSNITTYSGAQVIIGPFNSDKIYQVYCSVGSITITTNWYGSDVEALVTTRNGQPGRTVANGGAVTQVQEWHSVVLTSPAKLLTLTYGNFTANAGVLSQLDNGASQLTLRMGVRLSSGASIAGYLPGSTTRDLVLAPGDRGKFEVDLGNTYPAGTRIWLHVLGTYANAPTNWAATDVVMSRADEFNEFGNALTDRTLDTTWPSGTRTTNYSVLSPFSITAKLQASVPTVGIVGDSITAAGNNDGTFGDYIGWAQRGIAASYAQVIMGAQGMTLGALMGSATQRDRRFTGMKLTHVLCPLGTNDLSGGSTDAQLYANMMSFKTYLDDLGIKLIPCTLPPRTNAANNAKYGADSANVWGYRTAYNNTLRVNNGVGYGFFDAAAYMQDANNVDLWRSDLGTPTSDGIHPATLIHTPVAAAFAAILTPLLAGYDVAAPVIFSSNATSIAENTQLAFPLLANEAVTWSLRTSGQNAASVDYNKFELNGSILTWVGNGTVDYENPTDTGTNNTYVVVIRATDAAGNFTDQTFTATVTDQDEIPNTFTFVDVTGATVSTVYTSNTATIAGLGSGVSTPVNVSGGTYSKNGGAYTSAAGTAVNGDTFSVRQTSSAIGGTQTDVTLTIGGVSDTYSVTTAGAAIGNELKPANIAAAYTMYQSITAGDVINMYGAWFTPGAPYAWYVLPTAGCNVIGHPSQVMVVRGDTQANCQTEFNNCFFSGTAYQGNTNQAIAYEYSDVDLRDCSKVAFKGCTFAQGDWGLMLRGGSGCSDIVVDYCLFYFQMVDCIRILNGGASNRIVVTNSYLADQTHQEKTFAKADNTNPVINSINPGGYTDVTPYNEHHDGIQAYGAGSGTLYDARIQYNTIKARGGQAIFLDDSFQVRCVIADNVLQVGQAHAARFAQGTDCEISRNTIGRTATYDSNVQATITHNRPGGTGNAKGGQNTYNAGITTIDSDTGITYNGGSIQGTATAPTAPTWSGTTSNVANLNTLRTTLPAYTDYTGPAQCARKPYLWVDGSAAPYAAGVYFKLIHDEIIGFNYPFNSCWIRWKKDGVVQATGQYTSGGSTAAFVSPATTGGSWTGGFSFDSTNGTDGTWYDSDAVTVTAPPSGTTLNPSDKAPLILLSNGNLTATKDTGANSHAMCRTIGKIEQADGDYVFNFTPSSGNGNFIALLSSNRDLTSDPTDFGIGKAFGMFSNGQYYATANSGNFSISDSANGTNAFTMLIRRTGSGANVRAFLKGPSGWYVGGDPYAGTPGVGEDLSASFAGQDIYPAAWLTVAGQSVTFDFVSPYSPAPGGSPQDV